MPNTPPLAILGTEKPWEPPQSVPIGVLPRGALFRQAPTRESPVFVRYEGCSFARADGSDLRTGNPMDAIRGALPWATRVWPVEGNDPVMIDDAHLDAVSGQPTNRRTRPGA